LTIRTKILAAAMLHHDVEGALAVVGEVVPAAVKGLPGNATLAVDALEQQSFMLAKLTFSEASYAALRQAIAIGEQYLGPTTSTPSGPWGCSPTPMAASATGGSSSTWPPAPWTGPTARWSRSDPT
jgi:hypothetical protein